MFKKKQKEKLNCLGCYDIKPYHYFESNMAYQKNPLLLKNEFVKVYARLYKNTLMLFVFIENEENFSKDKYTCETLENELIANKMNEYSLNVNLYIFKNNNEKTISIAKEQVKNTKNYFSHTFVYDSKNVRLNYYRPVPSFYKLYDYYQEALVADLGVIDLEK